MAGIEVNAELLQELGWWKDDGMGNTVPPQDPSASQGFPSSFPSMAAAIDYINKKRGGLNVELSEMIVDGCANQAYALHLKKAGWEYRPVMFNELDSESYPSQQEFVYLVPGSSLPDQGVEGRDFYSKYALFDAVLQVDAGTRDDLPGLSKSEANRLVLSTFLNKVAWILLEPTFDLTNLGSYTDSISMAPKSATTPSFRSKRAFFRACHDLVLSQGLPPLPVAPFNGQESENALFVKLMSPRYGFTWRVMSDGTPLFLPRTANLEDCTLGQDMFQTLAEARNDCMSKPTGQTASSSIPVRQNASSSKEPAVALASLSGGSAVSRPTPTAVAAGATYKKSTPKGVQHQIRTTPVAPMGSNKATGGGGGGAAAAPLACPCLPDLSNPENEEDALYLEDSFDDFGRILCKTQGWSYAYEGGNSNRLHPPGTVKGTKAVKNKDYFTEKDDLIPILQRRYKISHVPADLISPNGRRQRKASRAANSRSADTGKAAKDVVEKTSEGEEKSPDPNPNMQAEKDADDCDYAPLQGHESIGDMWKRAKELGWKYNNGSGLTSYRYIRVPRPKKGENWEWKKGVHYFDGEEEVKAYITDRIKERELKAAGASSAERRDFRFKRTANDDGSQDSPNWHPPKTRTKRNAGADDQMEVAEEDEEEVEEDEKKEQQQKKSSKAMTTKGKADPKKGPAAAKGGSKASGGAQASRLKAVKREPESKRAPAPVAKKAKIKAEDIGEPEPAKSKAKGKAEPKAKGKAIKPVGKGKKGQDKVEVEEPEAEQAPAPELFYGIDLTQHPNWVWKDLTFHGWRAVAVRKTPDCPEGLKRVPPGMNGEGQRGKDWFDTVEEVVDYVQKLQKDGKLLPSKFKLEEGSQTSSDEEEPGARAAIENEGMEEQEEEEEEDDGEEEEEEDEDDVDDDEADDALPIESEDTFDLLKRKFIRQHGFREQKGRLIPPRGKANGKRGIDYMMDRIDLVNYYVNHQLGPCFSNKAASSSSGGAMGGGGAQAAGASPSDGEAAKAKALSPLHPMDLDNYKILGKKLQKLYGWKHVHVVHKPGTLAVWTYIPPNGKVGPDAIQGEDYCVTHEEMKNLAHDLHLKGDVLLYSQAAPSAELSDDLINNMRFGHGAKGLSDDPDEEDDDDDDEDDEDDDEEEAEDSNDAPAGVPMDVEQVDAEQEDINQEEQEESAGGKNDQAHTETIGQSSKQLLIDPMIFNADIMADMWDHVEEHLKAKEILMKIHGWRFIKSSNRMLGDRMFYIAPGGRLPSEGGFKGKDYMNELDEVSAFIRRGYGLKRDAYTHINDVPLPEEGETTPEATAARATRSGRAYTSNNLESPPDHRGNQMDGDEFADSMFCSQDSDKGSTAKGRGGGGGKSSMSAPPAKKLATQAAASKARTGRRLSGFQSPMDGGGGGGGATVAYITPAQQAQNARGNKKRAREEKDKPEGEGAPVEKLTDQEVDHYTLSVLKAKGVELRTTNQAGKGGRKTMIPRYEIALMEGEVGSKTPDLSKALPKNGSFGSAAEALHYVRKEGMVSEEDLLEHSKKDPYKPLIDAMLKAARQLGLGGYKGSYADVRTSESQALINFYEGCLMKPGGGWLRVGGLPGTGKTLTTLRSEKLLGDALANKEFAAKPTFVYINCAARGDPLSFIENILQQLGLYSDKSESQKSLSRSELFEMFKDHVSTGRRARTGDSQNGLMTMAHDKAETSIQKSVVLVLDEADQLFDKVSTMQMLVDVVVLAMEPRSRLILVTIANTIDDQSLNTSLQARVSDTVQSVFGREPLIFRAYTNQQIMQILKHFVGETFQENAMTLIAKKVTSNRGDCRLAVDICRQAVEDRLETLKSWSVNNIEPVDLDQHRCITVKEVMPLCNNRELDPELGRRVEGLPVQSLLLLLLIIKSSPDVGARVPTADLHHEYTQISKRTLGTNQWGASTGFDDTLIRLQDSGLVDVTGSRSNKSITSKLSMNAVLPRMTEANKTLFRNLLPSTGGAAAGGSSKA